jgi:hypothetical protein
LNADAGFLVATGRRRGPAGGGVFRAKNGRHGQLGGCVCERQIEIERLARRTPDQREGDESVLHRSIG